MEVEKYLAEMNISPRLYDLMVRTAPEQIRVLTKTELSELGLDATDPLEQEIVDGLYATKYGLAKTEYLARKRLAHRNCPPNDLYVTCYEKILTGADQ